MEATQPIENPKRKDNPFSHKSYKEDDAETRERKIKQLSKANRYIKYYQTLSDKYFPKLVAILDDIVHKCKSDGTISQVKEHFESLVKFLRGDGEPVTPISVYVHSLSLSL